ncbi:DNA replication protein DnaC [Modicisalibacter xianhensis]|uniref:DNA replication protein DnaC n=1 Tax=Modicisalibacter xianhensis TaxID=442341 RepID=A0A4R8FRD4_9GAMM|nr:ATP-binding protein [Halomonas xianhensis]TDX29129.1 DNA replication protein DnaC [Halomonas xianhensis]
MTKMLTTTPQVRGHLAGILAGTAKNRNETCRIHGEYAATLMPNGKWSSCPHCVQDDLKGVAQAEIEQAGESAAKRRLEKLREGSMIPRRFQAKTLANFEHGGSRDKAQRVAVCKAYVERFTDRLEQGGGLVFTGGVGTGKSHLAYAIGNALLAQGYRVMGIDVYELIDLIKERAFGKKESSERDAIKAFVAGLDLLILDEIGAQLGTEWERLMLFKIINERYKAQLPTILISNVDSEKLGEYLGERIVDRMQEGGGATLTLDWESYRSQRGAA